MTVGIPVYTWEACTIAGWRFENVPETPPPDHIVSVSPFLRSAAEIDTLETINGLSIDTIEKRARPGAASYCGFIAHGEHFKDVLRHDWALVKKMDLTHVEIARHLEKIVSVIDEFVAICISDQLTMNYDPNALENSKIHASYPQKLECTHYQTRGFQADLFDPNPIDYVDEVEEPPVYKYRQVATPIGWSSHYEIKNLVNGESITLNAGLLSYIREFGFYEGGGEKNPWRADPCKIIAVLTGESLSAIRNRINGASGCLF